MPLATQRIASLSSSFPNTLVLSVNPTYTTISNPHLRKHPKIDITITLTFGKTNAHHPNPNSIPPSLSTACKLATTANAHSQNAKTYKNMPTKTATGFNTSLIWGYLSKNPPAPPPAAGTPPANPTSATILYAAAPTGINIPGRIFFTGSPVSRSDFRYIPTARNDTHQPKPCHATPVSTTSAARWGGCDEAMRLATVPVSMAE
ncbi:SLAC1 domain containing protein [Pyrenophora teres f. maculata]|nr:SLAC1 domain containing protein [Pyrenophora teres f. maculata]